MPAVSAVEVMWRQRWQPWDSHGMAHVGIGPISGRNQVDIGVHILCVTAMCGAPRALRWPHTSPQHALAIYQHVASKFALVFELGELYHG